MSAYLPFGVNDHINSYISLEPVVPTPRTNRQQKILLLIVYSLLKLWLMCIILDVLAYRGRVSLSLRGATGEVRVGLATGGGMIAEQKNSKKKNNTTNNTVQMGIYKCTYIIRCPAFLTATSSHSFQYSMKFTGRNLNVLVRSRIWNSNKRDLRDCCLRTNCSVQEMTKTSLTASIFAYILSLVLHFLMVQLVKVMLFSLLKCTDMSGVEVCTAVGATRPAANHFHFWMQGVGGESHMYVCGDPD